MSENLSRDLRPTLPPGPADDISFLKSCWVSTAIRRQATAVRFYLQRRISVLPEDARHWLREVSRENKRRAATARRLLARVAERDAEVKAAGGQDLWLANDGGES